MANKNPEYSAIAAQFAAAKAKKDREPVEKARDDRVEATRFKAAHGLLVAFLLWMLYVFDQTDCVYAR